MFCIICIFYRLTCILYIAVLFNTISDVSCFDHFRRFQKSKMCGTSELPIHKCTPNARVPPSFRDDCLASWRAHGSRSWEARCASRRHQPATEAFQGCAEASVVTFRAAPSAAPAASAAAALCSAATFWASPSVVLLAAPSATVSRKEAPATRSNMAAAATAAARGIAGAGGWAMRRPNSI